MKIKKYNKINYKFILMICTFFMYFSIGIWSSYRGIWLDQNNYSLSSISKILSISFIISSIISIIISIISFKINIKSLVLSVIFIRFISLILLLIFRSEIIVNTSIVIIIICESVFMLSFYPLLSYIDSSDKFYRRKNIAEYFGSDIGTIVIGFLLGRKINNYIFSYNSIIIIICASSLISFFILMFTEYNNVISKSNKLNVSLKNIFSKKSNIIFLIACFFTRISYSSIFDFIIIILTKILGLNIFNASILIIISNMIGNVFCIILNSINDKISVSTGIILKFMPRVIVYLISIIFNLKILFIINIIVSYITSKILDNKTSGIFIRQNSNEDKFLFENIRYFIEGISEALASFIFGILIIISLKYLFLFSMIITMIQILILIYGTKYIDEMI